MTGQIMSPEPSAEPANPYVGPQQFDEKHRNYYFGRDREARDLLSVVIAHRLVLFYSPSGAGKSSLLKVRLIPGLRSKDVRYLVLPLARVGVALSAEAGEIKNVYAFNVMTSIDGRKEMAGVFADMKLKDFMLGLHTSDGKAYAYDAAVAAAAIAERARDPQAVAPSQSRRAQPPHVLIIDQFEEIATTHPTRWPDREQFFAQLNAALEDDPQLWIVLSMRSDYVPEIERYTPNLPNYPFVRFAMERMSEAAAHEAVERPAAQKGHRIAADAAEEIVRNLLLVREQSQDAAAQAGEFVQPVQLQVVCYQMWERLKDTFGAEITIEDLKRLADGDLTKFVDNALGDFYEDRLRQALALKGLSVSEAELRTWFSDKLITEAGTRGFLNKGKTETEGMPNQVVEFLEDKYLLRVEARASAYWYELVHDRFIEPIRARNRAWLLENAQPLVLAEREWVESDKSPDKLLKGDDLKKAVAATQGQHQTPEVTEFLKASQEAEQMREMEEARRRELEAQQQAEKERQQAEKERLRADREATLSRRLRGLAAFALAVTLVALLLLVRSNNNAKEAAIQKTTAEAAVVVAKTEIAKAVEARATAEAAVVVAKTKEAMAVEARAAAVVAQAETKSLRLADQARAALILGNADRALAFAVYANQVVTQTAPSASRAALAQAVYASQTRDRHELGSPVYSAALDATHQLAVAGDENGIVTFWNLASGGVVTRTAHAGKVWSVALSPDGSRALSAGDDGRVLYWDVQNRTSEPLTGNFGDKVFSVAFLPRGDQAVFGGSDSKLHLWDLTANREIRDLSGHDDWVYSVAVSPNGSQAVSGSEDQSMILWDLATGQLVRRFGGKDAKTGHRDWVRAVAFSPDGKTALSGSRNESILWNLESGSELRRFRTGGATIYSLAFAPRDSGKFLTGGGGITLWDATSGIPRQLSAGEPGAIVRTVAFGSDVWTALSGGLDGVLRLWDLGTGTAVASLRPSSGALAGASLDLAPPQECGMTDSNADFGPIEVGSQVILGRHREVDGEANWADSMVDFVDKTATVTRQSPVDSQGCPGVHVDIDKERWFWRIRDLRLVVGGGGVTMPRHDIRSLAVSPDGNFALTGSSDGSLTLWDTMLGRQLRTWIGYAKGMTVTAVAFVDNELAVTGAEDGSLRLWDVIDAQEKRHWPDASDAAPQSPIVGLAVGRNPDGSAKVSAYTADGQFLTWSPDQGQKRSELNKVALDKKLISAATFFSNAGEALLGLDDGALWLWDGMGAQPIEDTGATSNAGSQLNPSPGGEPPACGTSKAVDAVAYQTFGSNMQALVARGNCIQLLDIRFNSSTAAARRFGDGSADVERRRVASLVKQFSIEKTGRVHQLSFSADNRTAFWGTDKGLWRWRLDEKEPQLIGGSTQNPVPAKWVALTGNQAVTSDGYSLSLSDLTSGQLLHQVQAGAAFALTDKPGRALVGSDEGGITAWDWLSPGGAMTKTLILAQGLPFAGLATAGPDRIVTGSYTGTLTLWNATTGEAIASAQVMTRAITSLTASADGRWAAAGAGDGGLRLWDLEAWQEKALPKAPGAGPHIAALLGLAFSADGQRLLSGDREGRAILWDLNAGQPVEVARLGRAITSVALSPDGKRAWLGLNDGKIVVEDVETRRLQTLAGQTQAIQSLILSPDGNLALSGSADRSLVLWDAEEGAELTRLVHPAPVWQAAFGQDTDDTAYAVSSDANGVLHAWRLAPPADQLVAWGLGHGRYVPQLGCDEWDALKLPSPAQGCTPSSGGALVLGPMPTPTPAAPGVAMLTPTRTARSGQQRGRVPPGGSELWRVSGERGQALSIQAIPDRPVGDAPVAERPERGRLALRVELHPPTGDPIQELSFVMLRGGDYTLAVGSTDGASSGAYTLTLALPQQLTAGEEITPTLAPAARDLWSFSGTGGQFVRVDMTSADFDTHLDLYDPDGNKVAENDNFEGRNSRLGDLVLTSNGLYTIIARGLSDSSSGAYHLSLTQHDSRPITLTETKVGTFDTPTTWTFNGKRGQLLRIALDPTDDPTILPALSLLSPEGNEIEHVVNSDQQHNSLLPSVVLPSGGLYIIVPTAQAPIGGYRLSLSTPETRKIGPGEKAEQNLNAGVVWELAGTAGKRLIIRLEDGGDGIDPYLTVYGADGSAVTDDDSGGDSNSQLILEPPSDGRIVVPKDLGGRTSGRYRLKVEVDNLSELGGSDQALRQLINLSTEGKIADALALYQRIQDLGGADIPLSTRNGLCWFGALNGYERQVIAICEQLVVDAEAASSDRLRSYRDSRGIARALTGDIRRAIADFQFAVQYWKDNDPAAYTSRGHKREEWVRRLERGDPPNAIFDASTLEALKTE
ncbi:MAG: hypothetical protein NT169_28130 [Chloroflexi bacterium]|nr:hypothetical protein [Chloroflexota bacterium]